MSDATSVKGTHDVTHCVVTWLLLAVEFKFRSLEYVESTPEAPALSPKPLFRLFLFAAEGDNANSHPDASNAESTTPFV
tara:strand:- start:124 stop:360 length:237 start_codon:yes stop_codon:yes gene_type:complete